jgi:hypothetical protein
MVRNNIGVLLEGGDRRSIGRSRLVTAMVLKKPELFRKLVNCFWSKDRVVRMGAADAAEKVTQNHPGLLRPYKKELLSRLAEANEPELCWHLAVMVPRLSLNPRERQLATSSLGDYLSARSSIVKTAALQGLADLAQNDAGIRSRGAVRLR